MQNDQHSAGEYQEALDAPGKTVLAGQGVQGQPTPEALQAAAADTDSFWEWEVSDMPERLLEASSPTEAIENEPHRVMPTSPASDRRRSGQPVPMRHLYAVVLLIVFVLMLVVLAGGKLFASAGVGVAMPTGSTVQASSTSVLLTPVAANNTISQATGTATVVAMQIPAATTTPQPSSTATHPVVHLASGKACSVLYSVGYQWHNSLWASITITNTSTTSINGWALVFTLPNNQQIARGWNGVFSQQGSQVTISNTSSNGILSPGGTVSPSYRATGGGNNPPTTFALNGVSCSVVSNGSQNGNQNN